MIRHCLFIIGLSRCVLTQPLEFTQYIALMNVYDGLGSSHLVDAISASFSFFFVFRRGPGCHDELLCPRFNASSDCFGKVVCRGPSVIGLCVLGCALVFFVSELGDDVVAGIWPTFK